METDKGFFIENLLKDSKSEKCEKNSEAEGFGDSTTVIENSNYQKESDWLNPGSCSTSKMIDILPTVYPVISNRLDTHEGKRD
jgi:hypothetical protein